MGVVEEGARTQKNGHSAKAEERRNGQGITPKHMEGERYRH